MPHRVRIEQNDKTKRWQWQLLDESGNHVCMSGIHGFRTGPEAREAAMHHLGAPVEVDGDYGPIFAGRRDFSD